MCSGKTELNMSSYKKFFVIFLLVSLLIFPLATFAIGGCRNLEVQIPGLTTTCLPILPEYILAIFNFSLMVIGLVAFVALLYGGFRYLTSVGNPAAINDAKDQIFSAFLGLIILFSSWLILNTINPELIILGEPNKVPIGGMPGGNETGVVTVYKDANYKGDSCQIPTSVSKIEDTCGGGWSDEISSLKITDPNYIVVLHEHIDFAGLAQVFSNDSSTLDADMNDKTSSITLIEKGPESSSVTLYEDDNFEGVAFSFYNSNLNFTELKYTDDHDTPDPSDDTAEDFNDKASSIKVGPGAIAILFEHATFKGCALLLGETPPIPSPIPGDNIYAHLGENPKCSGWFPPKSWGDTVSSIYVIHGTRY
jgi:hypothetical protein